MTTNTPRDDEQATTSVASDSPKPEPPAWQLGVPLVVTLAALAALVVFVYGFCTTVR